MNSSESRRKEGPRFIQRVPWKRIYINYILPLVLVAMFLSLLIWMAIGINSCCRKDYIESSHLIDVYLNKLPHNETPLVITDSLVFDDLSTDTLCLVFYYHHQGEINQHRYIGIPLSKCKFTGKPYDYKLNHRSQCDDNSVSIEVQGDSIGELIYNNDVSAEELIRYLQKDPGARYTIHGDPDSIPKYIGVRKKRPL